MDKAEDVRYVCVCVRVCVCDGILLIHKKEWSCAIYSKMGGHWHCHTKWSKSDRERQISYDTAFMWNLKKNGTNDSIYETEVESQM